MDSNKASVIILTNIELTQETLAFKLSKLKVNEAPGVDGIVHIIIIITWLMTQHMSVKIN
jgi:hypothetical protein